MNAPKSLGQIAFEAVWGDTCSKSWDRIPERIQNRFTRGAFSVLNAAMRTSPPPAPEAREVLLPVVSMAYRPVSRDGFELTVYAHCTPAQHTRIEREFQAQTLQLVAVVDVAKIRDELSALDVQRDALVRQLEVVSR